MVGVRGGGEEGKDIERGTRKKEGLGGRSEGGVRRGGLGLRWGRLGAMGYKPVY